MPQSANTTAALRRIRALAADLTRELALKKPGRDVTVDMAAAIYAAADGALVAPKSAKPRERIGRQRRPTESSAAD
jgi:hypothetical protein